MTCSIRIVNTKTGVEKTICLRGAFLTDNKTSQCEAEVVRDRVFGYGRSLLQGWKAKFVSMFVLRSRAPFQTLPHTVSPDFMMVPPS